MIDISSGFQTSPIEVITFLVIIGIITVALIVTQLLNRREARQRARRRAAAHKAPILRSRSAAPRPTLPPKHQNVLDRLAWFLKNPNRITALLEDPEKMLLLAKKGLQEGVVQEKEIRSLLRYLGVDPEQLFSRSLLTSTIPPGSEVSVSTADLSVASGVFVSNRRDGLLLRIDRGGQKFRTGLPLEIVCYSADGMHQFHSTLLRKKGKHLLVSHSRHVRHAQRRRYRRHEIEIPIRIGTPGFRGAPLETVSVDMSIGGVAVRNPKKKLVLGALVECTLEAGSTPPLVVTGTVVRLSRRKTRAHISFSAMNDRTRHRLFRRLIQGR
ncbi:PilZ domain-containing protein [Alkalispirochaeta alkalica]|uniref:PilZ domain-containing protein n=1 Tax=Alkalispirochaeta alkalica TaxID=46356 RepID=UPI0003759B60|nr:PilZ domain-containing protein [Alkalispirochaeta alkalica]